MASFATRSAVLSSAQCLLPATNMNDRSYYNFAASGKQKPKPPVNTLSSSAPKKPTQENTLQSREEEQFFSRRSGSKRDRETATSTDITRTKSQNKAAARKSTTTTPTTNAAAAVGETAKQTKVKVTYVLPNQSREEGHFYVVLGEDIDVSTQRFKILSMLGEGTFGKVVEAWDRKRKEYCAVKIVRNVPKYTRDAKIEIQFMEKVRQADADDRFSLMKIQRYFQNETGHMCIVMPKYGPCLLDWIMKHGALSHRHLAQIIFQAGTALDYFHTELRLMHTDLKPENMLLETSETVIDPVTRKATPPDPCRIRICDLGGCCDERHSRTAIVSTRHYRSPEVVLGLGWMYSTDMWSMGCIIYELYTGKLLYDTHDNLEHLHLMEKTLGRLPQEWAGRCGTEEARQLYNSVAQLRPCTDPKHLARIARARPVREVISDKLLCDLIYGLLHYDRQKRLTARQMTTHQYVLKYYPECRQHPNYPDNRPSLRPTPLM
ncbi:putative kinetoplastid kinetochore protein 19 [Trypanosoma cruzi]|uniref:Protein kinase, putative n=2 Tax=Trypanosoma cruzi TaxID=5693 RepID=Q4D7Q4_TRYCC|nr:protein kinase, putative [Trypanosoma cruzi]EAN88562.1 protein kinase, putative [Trypanosoma cruzi]PWV09863.1 putative kinetoplastid kinetochore protein 19 [Trypanosoma cruzi]|eukprot:XP_810413.1 protein kinase [Trypanosoma cruzi strain CL Brener]